MNKEVKRIVANQPNGCAPACIAMILGWEYDEVIKYFQQDFDEDGITHDVAIDFIADQGYSAITKSSAGYTHRNFLRDELLKPFAPIHFVSVKPWGDSTNGHAIVMLEDGSILDPYDSKKPMTIEQVYRIKEITGFWDERKLYNSDVIK